MKRMLAMFAGALALGLAPGAAAQWKPERAPELVVSVEAGGNQDITARTIQAIWQERRIVASPTIIMNRPGGAGAIAYAYLEQHPRDPHYLLILPPTLLTNRIIGTSTVTHRDFTPVAMLFNEYIFVTVRADSPIRTGRDLIERLRKAPDSLSVAVATAIGNHIHMGIALPMKAAGVDIRRMKVVAFKSSGQSLTAVLGGHVDVAASTFAALLPQVSAGRLRIVGVSSPHRMTGVLADVPTWKEQGVNAEFDSWRGVVSTRGIGKAQLDYWEGAFSALSQTDEWKRDNEKNFRVANYMGGAEAARYWDAQYKELEGVLTELGLAKRSQ